MFLIDQKNKKNLPTAPIFGFGRQDYSWFSFLIATILSKESPVNLCIISLFTHCYQKQMVEVFVRTFLVTSWTHPIPREPQISVQIKETGYRCIDTSAVGVMVITCEVGPSISYNVHFYHRHSNSQKFRLIEELSTMNFTQALIGKFS